MENTEVLFGLPDQWAAFGTRNRVFLEKFDGLRLTLRALLERPATLNSIDRFIFVTSRLAADDFMELFLLCGNAEGYAAQKVLRPMFERVVTLGYLAAHPEELDRFFDYHWISQHKLVHAIETTFETDLLDRASVREVEEKYEEIKKNYRVTACDKCGTTRIGIAWSPKDVISMAKEVGLSTLIVPAYYLPLQQAHPSVKGMLDRLELLSDGKMAFGDRLQPELADRVLCAAHALLVFALQTFVQHFKLDEGRYKHLGEDFAQIWEGRT